MADNRVTRLQRTGTPFVTIGRTARPRGTCWVDIDSAGLVQRCVDHLADLGHRDIALINRSAELFASGYGPARRAHQGFDKALVRRDVTGIEFHCGDNAGAGERCVEEILLAHPEITAIVTINEAALPGMRRALDRAGLESPDRFSVTGIVARHWAEQFHPRLTAVDLPAEEMGATAVRFLVERIADPAADAVHALLTPPISLRGSTGPANRTR